MLTSASISWIINLGCIQQHFHYITRPMAMNSSSRKLEYYADWARDGPPSYAYQLSPIGFLVVVRLHCLLLEFFLC